MFLNGFWQRRYIPREKTLRKQFLLNQPDISYFSSYHVPRSASASRARRGEHRDEQRQRLRRRQRERRRKFRIGQRLRLLQRQRQRERRARGNNRGGAYGFKLVTLTKLQDTKTTDNKRTLLQWIVEMLERREPAMLQLSEDLVAMSGAASAGTAASSRRARGARRIISQPSG